MQLGKIGENSLYQWLIMVLTKDYNIQFIIRIKSLDKLPSKYNNYTLLKIKSTTIHNWKVNYKDMMIITIKIKTGCEFYIY